MSLCTDKKMLLQCESMQPDSTIWIKTLSQLFPCLSSCKQYHDVCEAVQQEQKGGGPRSVKILCGTRLNRLPQFHRTPSANENSRNITIQYKYAMFRRKGLRHCDRAQPKTADSLTKTEAHSSFCQKPLCGQLVQKSTITRREGGVVSSM